MFETRFNIKLLTTAILLTATVLIFTHLPQETMSSPLQQDGYDTVQHFLAYGVITFLFLIAIRTSPTIFSALLLFLVVSAIGALDELTQLFVGRTASVTDLVADIVGILAALCFVTVRGRRSLRSTSVK